MSLKPPKIDPTEHHATFDDCSSFLTDRLGFSPDRINRRVIERVAQSLSSRPISCRQAEAALIAAITVGETYFFRHRHQFEWLIDTWLPRWMRRREARLRLRPLRILSAGCATGEEAYTLAAVLHRQLTDKRMPFEITALDVNTEFLQRAEAATYGLWSLRGVQIEEERDWLDIEGNSISVRRPVRQLVRFAHHNLMESLADHPELSHPFDLIVCRNVLIYFHDDAVQQTYEHLGAVLHDHGTLVVGPSDPGPSEGQGLTRHWEDGVRYYVADSGVSPVVPRRDQEERHHHEPHSPPPYDRKCADSPPPDHGPSSHPATVDACAVARRLSRLSSTDVACDFLRHHLGDHPLDVEAHVLAAMYCAELDQFEEAFEWGRRAVFLAPGAPYVIFVLADICKRCHRDEGCRRYTQWARKLLRDRNADDTLQYSSGSTVHQLREVLDVHHR